MSKAPTRVGATCVEFAMTASVLVIFFFGLLEVARFHLVRHTLDQAAYEGARAGIIPGATTGEVEQRVRSILSAVGVRAPQISVTPNDLSSPASQVSVLVQVRYGDNSWASERYFKGMTLAGEATLDREPAAYSN